jgi:hypothetical protein
MLLQSIAQRSQYAETAIMRAVRNFETGGN